MMRPAPALIWTVGLLAAPLGIGVAVWAEMLPLLGLVLVLSLASTGLSLWLPLISKDFFDHALLGRDLPALADKHLKRAEAAEKHASTLVRQISWGESTAGSTSPGHGVKHHAWCRHASW